MHENPCIDIVDFVIRCFISIMVTIIIYVIVYSVSTKSNSQVNRVYLYLSRVKTGDH